MEEIDLSNVPRKYHDPKHVFSKQLCTISASTPTTLLCYRLASRDSPFHKKKLYNLFHPEKQAREKYITESLAVGLIRLSSSPMEASFFFVEKKDKSIYPCIDFRGLSNITFKNKYPLLLIDSAFGLLYNTLFFSKLDCMNAYHLV